MEPTATTVVRPIESRSVADQVMTELRRSILSGALAPGREFSLRELAEMLQVSIIPVREALRSLENQGLVQMRPGRSAVVAPLDLDELQSIYRLRRRLARPVDAHRQRAGAAPELQVGDPVTGHAPTLAPGPPRRERPSAHDSRA